MLLSTSDVHSLSVRFSYHSTMLTLSPSGHTKMLHQRSTQKYMPKCDTLCQSSSNHHKTPHFCSGAFSSAARACADQLRHTRLICCKPLGISIWCRVVRLQQLLTELCQLCAESSDELAGLLHAQLRSIGHVPLDQLLSSLCCLGNDGIEAKPGQKNSPCRHHLWSQQTGCEQHCLCVVTAAYLPGMSRGQCMCKLAAAAAQWHDHLNGLSLVQDDLLQHSEQRCRLEQRCTGRVGCRINIMINSMSPAAKL